MLSALLIGSLLVCAPLRADDSNTGDAGAKPASPATTENTASSKAKAAKSETNKTEAGKPAPDYREEIEELRQMMREQSQQMAEQQKQLELLREQLAATHTSAASAAPSAEPAAVHVVNGEMGYAVRPAAGTSTGANAPQDKPKGEEAPTSIHIKGITLTPGGFFAAETVWRQRATSADVNTPFTGIPFGGNSLSKTSEFNGSGRQSRISMLAEGKIDHAKFTGYYEMDFLSAGTTSNNRQSNSYTMRQRQFWGKAELDGGWAITGGQMWSLVTETKKGVNNRTEALPMTIDAQYNVGFSWARQFGFRVAKTFSDKFVLAFSAEEPQTTFGGRGVANGKFFFNAQGAGGGLYNGFDATGYTVNQSPDFIFKGALDPGWGHYELFGVVSRFRDRVFPCGAGISAANPCPLDPTIIAPSAVGAFNDSRAGGGIGANLRAPVLGHWGDLGLHVLGGSGVGRYSSAQLADVTARPDGTLAPIRGGSILGTLELHPSPKLDIYFNYGAEYAYRAWYDTTPTGAATASSVGYGSPFFNNSTCNTEVPPSATTATPVGPSAGACAGDIRNIQEGTLGFWHRFYKGPKGTVQWGIQYSYLVKNTWSGSNNSFTAVGVQPKAIENMVLTSFRYYLP
jgi:hypothetical protein